MSGLLPPRFKYVMSLPNPHPSWEVRRWLLDNDITYVYTTAGLGNFNPSIEYHFVEESHAAWFRLRWL